MKLRPWKLLTVLLVAALAMRLAAAWWWHSRLHGQFGFPDSETYWALAGRIAQGEAYEYGPERLAVFRTPGYPVLLAPIRCWASPETGILVARLQSALFGTAAVGALGWLARELFDARCALIAATMAAFYPGLIAVSVLVLSEAAFCVFLLLQLVLWTLACKAKTTGGASAWAFGGGLLAAAATLVRPSWLLFTPLAAGVGLLVSRDAEAAASGGLPERPRERIRQLWIAALMLLGLAAGMLPWWIRNARVTGRFVPTTLQVGASLYDGLNPNANGASNMDCVVGFVAEEHRSAARCDDPPEDPFEVRLDRRLRRAALGWAGEHPSRAIRLAAVKFGRLWNLWPNEPRLSSWPVRLAVAGSYLPVLALGLLGAARTIRRGWPYVLCWLPVVYFTMLHVIFVSSIRYRQPAMLGLIVLAAGVVGSGKTDRVFRRSFCTRCTDV